MMPKDKVITSLQTAQAELDKALEQLARMPAYDASRVRFAAHTLNNYLAVTGGCAELLQMTLGEDADEQTRTWLEGLRHATGLMTHIVVQLLNIPTTNGEGLVREKVNLQVLTDRACDYYRHSASIKQMTIITEPAATAPIVWTDRVAVAAVLDNLLSNAIKFSPAGRRVWVRISVEGANAVCAVRDEGPGLTLDDHAKLFERGAHLSNAPTAGEPTTGYGLAVAKDLIDQLGGEIGCDSRRGEGAAFFFRLPLYSEAHHGAAAGC
jgi:signal transduction histidine kinase